jgi:Ca2+-binding RTX toxin-like protein
VGTTISAAVSRLWNEFSTYADTTAYTIVDGSGYDTLDVSNFSTDQLINLAPSQASSTTPSRSNIGGKIGNLTIAVGTILEAASSGNGNDSFYGNDVANTFRGGGGNDSFYDSLGSDIYFGDAGIDTLFFRESIDLFRYQLSGDSLLFSRSTGSVDVDQVWKGLETLSFNSVAYTYDQLVQSLSLSPLATVTIASVNGLPSGSATNATSLSFSGTLSFGLSSNQSIAIYRDGLQVGSGALSAPAATSWTFDLQEAALDWLITDVRRQDPVAPSPQQKAMAELLGTDLAISGIS